MNGRIIAFGLVAALSGVAMPALSQGMMYGAGPGYGGWGGQPGWNGPMMGQGWSGPMMSQGWPNGPGGGWMPQWGQGMMRQGGPGPMAGAPVDADGDGLVSADEASARAEAVFAALDADGDDTVTRDEFLAAGPMGAFAMDPSAATMPMIARRNEVRGARFDSLDGDANGQIGRAEFVQAAQNDFTAADADGDGQVTVWEYRASHRPF